MDKKTYISPEIEIIEMEVSTVLAASITFGEGGVDARQSFGNGRRDIGDDFWF